MDPRYNLSLAWGQEYPARADWAAGTANLSEVGRCHLPRLPDGAPCDTATMCAPAIDMLPTITAGGFEQGFITLALSTCVAWPTGYNSACVPPYGLSYCCHGPL